MTTIKLPPHPPYPIYNTEDDTVTRIAKCIKHEFAVHGTAEAAALAILRDVKLGYIKIGTEL